MSLHRGEVKACSKCGCNITLARGRFGIYTKHLNATGRCAAPKTTTKKSNYDPDVEAERRHFSREASAPAFVPDEPEGWGN